MGISYRPGLRAEPAHQSWSYSTGQNSVTGTYLLSNYISRRKWGPLLRLSPTRKVHSVKVLLGIKSAVFLAVRAPRERDFQWGAERCLPHGCYPLNMIAYSHVNMHIVISVNSYFGLKLDCFSRSLLSFLLTFSGGATIRAIVITKVPSSAQTG